MSLGMPHTFKYGVSINHVTSLHRSKHSSDPRGICVISSVHSEAELCVYVHM